MTQGIDIDESSRAVTVLMNWRSSEWKQSKHVSFVDIRGVGFRWL
jgi:hypothetical protein